MGATRSCVKVCRMTSNFAFTTTHHHTPSHTITHHHTPSHTITHHQSKNKKTKQNTTNACLTHMSLSIPIMPTDACFYLLQGCICGDYRWILRKDALAIGKVVPRLLAFTCAYGAHLDKVCIHRIGILKFRSNHSRSTLGSNPKPRRRL